jgi:hypothetical protein
MMNIILSALGQRANSEIDLRTRANTPIENLQAWHHSAFEWNQLSANLKRFREPDAKKLGGCSPVYNCHGLTFGSRRTAVKESNEVIFTALQDDDFVEIPQDDVRPGDVILYLDSSGQVQHSGLVVDTIATGIARVWSKWGKGDEWIHHFAACPYDPEHTRYFRLK